MNVFEFARMVEQDIKITYSHKSRTFIAIIEDVLPESDESYVRGEDAHLDGALLNLCENLSCTSVTVWKDYGAFTLKTPAILLGDDWWC
jgi:hypothetical protein